MTNMQDIYLKDSCYFNFNCHELIELHSYMYLCNDIFRLSQTGFTSRFFKMITDVLIIN